MSIALFILAPNWKQYHHTMEYYSTIKRNKLMIHKETWDETPENYAEEKSLKRLILYDFIYVTLKTPKL